MITIGAVEDLIISYEKIKKLYNKHEKLLKLAVMSDFLVQLMNYESI